MSAIYLKIVCNRLFAAHIDTRGDEVYLFLLSVAGHKDGSASTGLSSELTVAEPTHAKRPVGRPKKRPRNLENGKLMLI